MRSSVHIYYKKDILIFGKGVTRGPDDTTITAATKYSNSFTEHKNKLCLSLQYNRSNSYFFANWVKIHQVKAKYSELFAYPLSLGNISKGFSVKNMNEKGLNWYVY